MKIIKQGSLPEERDYQIGCRNCGTVFEFARKEAELVIDQREGNYLKVHCPHCKNSCTTTP